MPRPTLTAATKAIPSKLYRTQKCYTDLLNIFVLFLVVSLSVFAPYAGHYKQSGLMELFILVLFLPILTANVVCVRSCVSIGPHISQFLSSLGGMFIV